MTQPHDAPLSDDARALLDAFTADESPTPRQQEDVWSSVGGASPPARRLRKVQTGPQATTPATRTWAWVAAAVAVAAAAVIVLGGREGQRAQRQEDQAPQTAPYQAEPSAVGGHAQDSGEPVPSVKRRVPAPVPPQPNPVVEDPPDIGEAAPPEPPLQRPSGVRHAPGADARAEIEALRKAKQALASGRGQEALQILSGASAARGRGQLGREREALRIEALCAVGQTDRARREAKQLLERTPAHPYADKLRRPCSN